MERFTIEKSKVYPNCWECLDAEYGILYEFEEGNYIDSRHMLVKPHKYAEVVPTPAPLLIELSNSAMALTDWLKENHRDKI